METTTLNGKKLHTIAHKTDTATRVFTALAMRERLRNESDIGRMKRSLLNEGEKIVPNDYKKVWEDLEAAGAGVIIRSQKRNKPARFEWHYSLKDVAKAAIENRNIKLQKIRGEEVKTAPVAKVTPIKAAPVKPVQKTILRKAEGAKVQAKVTAPVEPIITKTVIEMPVKPEVHTKTLVIPLRNSFLQIEIPSDLSIEEAKMFAKAVMMQAK